MVNKRLIRTILSLALGIFFSGHILASDCEKQLNVELLNQCLGNEFADIDRELNTVYARLRTRLAENDKESLRKAELLWVDLREKDCEFEAASVAVGQAYESTFISCQSRYTRQRIVQLRQWAGAFKR